MIYYNYDSPHLASCARSGRPGSLSCYLPRPAAGAGSPKVGLQCQGNTVACESLGTVVFSGFIASASPADAERQAMANAVKYMNTIDCNKSHAKGTITIETATQSGTISSDGLSIPDSCKAGLKCTLNKDIPGEKQCGTRCLQTGFRCQSKVTAADCSVTKPPGERVSRMLEGRRKFGHVLEITCTLAANLENQCTCDQGCYANRGPLSANGQDYFPIIFEGHVDCICGSKGKKPDYAISTCTALMGKYCKENEEFVLSDETKKPLAGGLPGNLGEHYLVSGKCVKKTAPRDEPTTVPAPTSLIH